MVCINKWRDNLEEVFRRYKIVSSKERSVQDLFYNSHKEYTFHALAIPLEIALPAVFNVCPRAHNPLVEAGAHSYRDTFFEVPASPDICRRIMLLKGDCVATKEWEKERGRDLSKGGWEQNGGKCTSARGRGSICFLEQRRAFFRRC